MFRFGTVVQVLVCMLSIPAFAKDSSNGYAQKSDFQICKETLLADPKDKDCQTFIHNHFAKDNGEYSCPEAQKLYSKERSKFVGACGAIPQSDGKETGDIACEFTLARCRACMGTPSDHDDAVFSCDASDYGSSKAMDTIKQAFSGFMGTDTAGQVDIGKARSRYNNCPAIGATGLKDVKKDMDDARKAVKDDLDKIPDLIDKKNKAMSDMNQALRDIRKQGNDDASQHRKDVSEAAKDAKAAQDSIQQQITAIQGQILKANDALREAQLAKYDAATKMKQTKVQAALNCHTSAIGQVTKMQQDIMQKTRGGALSTDWLRGDMTTFMQNIGLSDRKSWQKQANWYYQECMKDQSIRDIDDGANDAYNSVVAHSNAQVTSVNDQIVSLMDQLSKLANGAACGTQNFAPNGTPLQPTQACQMQMQAAQSALLMEQDYQSRMAQTSQSYQDAQNDGYRNANTIQDQINSKQNEINSDNARYKNVQDLYALKNEFDNGGDVTKDQLAKAQSQLGKLSGAADDMMGACNCHKKSKDKKCKEAEALLALLGEEPDDDAATGEDIERSPPIQIAGAHADPTPAEEGSKPAPPAKTAGAATTPAQPPARAPGATTDTPNVPQGLGAGLPEAVRGFSAPMQH